MLLGSVIIFTPLLSKLILRKVLYRHTIVGIVISVFSLILICFASLLLEKNCKYYEVSISIVFMLIALFINSLQRVYEEWLLKKIETSLYRFIGLEGFYGIFFLFIFHSIMLTNHMINENFEYFLIGNEIYSVLSSK